MKKLETDRLIADDLGLSLETMLSQYKFWSINEIKDVKCDKKPPNRWRIPGGRW